MDSILVDYLNKFEEKVRKELLRLATERKELNGKILETSDIMDYWRSIEANYVADAVPQVANYPTVSVAWAFYLGMAVAYGWDVDWKTYRNVKYESFYGDEGFDNMDDHIVRDILGMPLESSEAKATVAFAQSLAQEAVSLIRHEQIEPQSPIAFYAFSRTCRGMFAIGAAVELRRLGYKFEKMV